MDVKHITLYQMPTLRKVEESQEAGCLVALPMILEKIEKLIPDLKKKKLEQLRLNHHK